MVEVRLNRLSGVQRRDWDDLAWLNPFDSILARFDEAGDWTEEEFFLEGEKEVSHVLARCAGKGIALGHGRALDFGCGVGRLSRALASRFELCIGADVSPAMLDRARLLNAHVPNLRFVQTGSALDVLEDASIDFIYTARVLQHIPSRAAIIHYLREFLRILRSDGILVAQIPTSIPWVHRVQARARLWLLLRSLGVHRKVLHRRLGLTPIRMVGLSTDVVTEAIDGAHGQLVDVECEAARPHSYPSATYFVRRRARSE
ncbi:MAG: class I SAM-dependent methyltransferase [Longimicrobiales bacterium]